MSENQKFKMKFDRMRENDVNDEPSDDDTLKSESYDRPGQLREVTFKLESGMAKSLMYSYLISITFDPTDKLNSITLVFTSDIIVLRGYRLSSLFDQFKLQLPLLVVQVNERYAGTETEESLVTAIEGITSLPLDASRTG